MGRSPTWGARAWGRPAALASPPWWHPGLPYPKSPPGQNHPQEKGAPEPGPRLPHGAPHRPLRARPPRRVSGPRLAPTVRGSPRSRNTRAPSPDLAPPCPALACALPVDNGPLVPPPCRLRCCPPGGRAPGRPLHPVPIGCTPSCPPVLCPQGMDLKWPTHPVPMEPAPQVTHLSCAHGVCTRRGPPHPAPHLSSIEPWGRNSN